MATPCATSSTLDLWRPPIMPSATTAESSDSIAASSAIVNAGEKSSRTRSSVRSGRWGAGIEAWISPKRVPIVSTGSPSQPDGQRCSQNRDDRGRDGARELRPGEENHERSRGDADRSRRGARQARAVRGPLREERPGHRFHPETEQVADLGREDDDRDPARETRHHGIRDELDRRPEARQAQDHQQHARDDRADRQAIDAVARDDAVHDDDECARGPADLDAAAAENRDQEAGHDRGDRDPSRARPRKRSRMRWRAGWPRCRPPRPPGGPPIAGAANTPREW